MKPMAARLKRYFLHSLVLCIILLLYLNKEILVQIKSKLHKVPWKKKYGPERDIYKTPLIYYANKSVFSVPFDILPRGTAETDDRIQKQLALNQRGSKDKFKVILDLTFNDFSRGQDHFLEKECPVNTCHRLVSHDVMRQNFDQTVDAIILMHASEVPSFLNPKRNGTIWIYFNLESPIHTYGLNKLKDQINWTATYRLDSTVVVPYWQYNRSQNEADTGKSFDDNVLTKKKTNTQRNYAEGKTKLVAWFVSNCYARSGRMAYARELQKYINVDIYGSCGTMRCSKDNMGACLNALKTDYKFFLAFENSICKNYITEKIHHALRNDALPIVLGAPKEDYERMAPPGSFIHVDDFRSPEHLAQYLHYLSQNDTAYNEYFMWKGHGEFVDNKFMCRICALLHERLPPIWYGDIDAWWDGEEGSSVCDMSKINVD